MINVPHRTRRPEPNAIKLIVLVLVAVEWAGIALWFM